jgi:DNA-binding MarR family transcriptional regulator
VDATTGHLLWRLTSKWRAAVDRAVAPLGLTHAQYSLLASLYGLSRTGARPSQRQLADFSGLDAIYVSKLARTLQQSGLITRIEHPGDPRAVQLALTDHGADVVVRAVGIVRDLHEDLTAPIGGTASPRGRALADTLRTLLHESNGDEAMPPTPTLTGQDIAEAQGAVQALLEATLAGTGTTAHEYIALRVLAVRGPFERPAALHEFLAEQRQLGLDAAGAAALLAGLEANGLATGTARDGAGPARITEAGAARHASLGETVAATTAELYAGFEPDDLATAHRVLAQVVERAATLRAR